MKIQSINLKHFKKFRDRSFDFTDQDTGLAKDMIVLMGLNGSGKTTLLQAIAATLGVAIGRINDLQSLDWAGYNYELLGKNWVFDTSVSMTVQFSVAELDAIHEFYQKLLVRKPLLEPSYEHIVTINWKDGQVLAKNSAEWYQFKGHEYAKQLRSSEGPQVFERIGTMLWYTEQRTSTTLTSTDQSNELEITYDVLRDRLSKFRQFDQDIVGGRIKKLWPGQKNLYAEIEHAYKTVFPERSFEGTIPRDGIDDIFSEPWFYLYDGRNQYEISEMSGGERAIFPMLMDFANWNINNSVILIDEIELHLHPPMQQALLRALPKLGKNNQFIITTHSDYVEQMVPDAHIIRL